MKSIPDDVRRFVIANIRSVSQLEVLLLLRGAGGRDWTAAEVSCSLYTSAEMMATQFDDLAARALIEKRSDAAPSTYRYATLPPGLEDLIERLAQAYQERRVAVISLIYAEPTARARALADAFLIRKKEE